MKVSIIVPAFNEEDVIVGCLQSLASQSYRDFEAIFIDDQSTDHTASLLKAFSEQHPKHFQWRQYGKVGPGRARNLAASEVSSDILAFLDADCEASPRWLEHLVQTYQETDAESVGGPQLAHPQSTPFQRRADEFFQKLSQVSDFYKPEGFAAPRETLHNPLCNTSYRRTTFLALGGFREDLFPGEDWELDYRLREHGKKIYFHPQAIVHHHRPETITQFRKVLFAYGRAQGKLVRDYGCHRGIQRLGVTLWTVFILLSVGILAFSVALASLLPALAWLIFCLGLWLYRPASEKSWSLGFHALSWFRGFATGFFTNESPPPVPKTESKLHARV